MNTKNSLAISRWLFVILMLGFLLFPPVSWAACYTACNHGRIHPQTGKCDPPGYPTDTPPGQERRISYDGLVPCGKQVYIDADSDCTNGILTKDELPCQLCHFLVLADAVLDFVIDLAFIVAVLLVVFAGLLFIVGEVLAGTVSPGLINKAKSILQSVLIGLVILFAAWIVVNTIFMFLGVADWTKSFTGPSNWFIIDCPIELPEHFN